MTRRIDVLIIGAGQAGLATRYYLRRSGLTVLQICAEEQPGGSWLHTWPSLRLFSPAGISSLPGLRLALPKDAYPAPLDITRYFADYEQRYGFKVERPVRALRTSGNGPFITELSTGETVESEFVVNATGNACRPYVPFVPGQRIFTGRQLHSRYYRGPEQFRGQRVAVIGGGNSGAQIAADLLSVAEVTWCTLRPPRFLPDSYDGAALFQVASAHVRGEEGPTVSELGDIVVVPPIKAARDTGLLQATGMFERLTPSGAVWPDGSEKPLDVVVWCTGFKPALKHLARYDIELSGTALAAAPRMHFVGYGDWVGPAADTILGVSPFAKAAARAIIDA
ncbi:NAD(P)-binding domain-containing protein [Corynebacterium sp. H130]|uniref:NAD(P)-binding domain-containing protein n=1 Tax=Corynebacterium sp. H130 TaxID=3133444 RepID=UPI0030A5B705